MNGSERIAAERERQVTKEGWTPEHDDEHDDGEMIEAAICYAAEAMDHAGGHYEVLKPVGEHSYKDPWPWSRYWDKRRNHRYGVFESTTQASVDASLTYYAFDGKIRCLEIAGALVAAEIDRIQRLKDNHMARLKEMEADDGLL